MQFRLVALIPKLSLKVGTFEASTGYCYTEIKRLIQVGHIPNGMGVGWRSMYTPTLGYEHGVKLLGHMLFYHCE